MDNFMRGFNISFMLGVLGLGAIDLVLARERSGLLKRVALINTIWLAMMTAGGCVISSLLPRRSSQPRC